MSKLTKEEQTMIEHAFEYSTIEELGEVVLWFINGQTSKTDWLLYRILQGMMFRFAFREAKEK